MQIKPWSWVLEGITQWGLKHLKFIFRFVCTKSCSGLYLAKPLSKPLLQGEAKSQRMITPLPCDRTVLHQQKLRTWATKSCAVGPPTPLKCLKARQQCQIVHPAWWAKMIFPLRSNSHSMVMMYGFGIEDKEAVALPHLWSVCYGTCDASWTNLLTESTQYCIFYNIYAVEIHSPSINAWAVKHNSHLFQLGFGYIHFKMLNSTKAP